MNTANQLLAHTLKARGVDTIFHITGAPNIQLTKDCLALGIELIGVRHEAAAAAMAFSYARVTGKPGICLAPAGPGAINMIPTAIHALAEETPIILLAGSSPLETRGQGTFQELDQVIMFEPSVKKALQVTRPEDIGDLFDEAVALATQPCQGPVYLDLPGDILGMTVPEFDSIGEPLVSHDTKLIPERAEIDAVLDALGKAKRPLIVSGSGVIWSGASRAMEEFVSASGVPFFTTPQGRGAVSEDHPLAFLSARSKAFREADFVLSVGTRSNFIIGHFTPPRWAADLTVAMINLDAKELEKTAPDIGIKADARLSLEALNAQLLERGFNRAQFEPWTESLSKKDRASHSTKDGYATNDSDPIHPMRLMHEISTVMERDAVLIEDGHDTIGFCRHSLKSHVAGHRINPGTMGNVGLGVPFGIGAKAAKPNTQVIVVSGDSAFGWNGIEIDTACRHNLPILVIICNNAGITARPNDESLMMPGQDLGLPDYQKVAEAFGGYGERVEKAQDIRPALLRAIESNLPAIINVVVDPHIASSTHMGFAGVMSDSYDAAKKKK